MKNTYLLSGFLTLVSVTLMACVTINIYFPAAAAEKAADKIIEEVWQLENTDESDRGEVNANPVD